MLHFLYNEIVFRPLLNLLVFLYHYIPDVGVVIILVTILVRLVLAPSMNRSLKSQRAMNELQPKLNEVREKHKDNQEAQARAIMQLYRDHKINPLSSCLPLLIQLPLLIALYNVFRSALGNHISGLYPFIADPGTIKPTFLGLLDLSRVPWPSLMQDLRGLFSGAAGFAQVVQHIYLPGLLLAILTGATQFIQSKMMLPKEPNTDPSARAMATQTTYIFPVVGFLVALGFPAGLALYWVAMTLFGIGQQYYVLRKQGAA